MKKYTVTIWKDGEQIHTVRFSSIETEHHAVMEFAEQLTGYNRRNFDFLLCRW